MEWSFNQILFLLLSCLAGVGMSYASFFARSSLSATSFTVVGIMCKIATVLINLLIWDEHASLQGLAALFVCLFAGVLYRQAPMKHTRNQLPLQRKNSQRV